MRSRFGQVPEILHGRKRTSIRHRFRADFHPISKVRIDPEEGMRRMSRVGKIRGLVPNKPLTKFQQPLMYYEEQKNVTPQNLAGTSFCELQYTRCFDFWYRSVRKLPRLIPLSGVGISDSARPSRVFLAKGEFSPSRSFETDLWSFALVHT